jgi:glyoxylase-like metal-dependent hydrolase (beta-lactamase superfamily II)
MEMGIAVEFLPVGDSNGDAILVKYGDASGFYLHVVDAGYADVGEQMIEHIERYYGRNVMINNMVVSHADNDHATGLATSPPLASSAGSHPSTLPDRRPPPITVEVARVGRERTRRPQAPTQGPQRQKHEAPCLSSRLPRRSR